MLEPLVESTSSVTLKHFRPRKHQVYFSPAGEDIPVLQQYIIDNYTKIQVIFYSQGLDFVYPPLQLLGGFSDSDISKIVNYYLPWQDTSGTKDSLKNTILLKCSNLIEGSKPEMPSVVNAEGRCFTLYPNHPSTFEEQFRNIAWAFSTPVGTYEEGRYKSGIGTKYNNTSEIDDGIRYSVTSSPRNEIRYSITSEPDISLCASYELKDRIDKRKHSAPVPEEEDELQRLFRQLRANMPDHAIRELLSNALKTNEVVSSLVVTSQFKIILPEYNNLEIKLTPKEKALYLLFLRHPEGLPFKLLSDYKKELGKIYRKVAKRDLRQVIEDTIETMVSPFTGDADTQRSRIKSTINKAFEDKFCKDYAQWYTINGTKGENMKIDLPQDKIVWEVDL